MFLIVTTNEAKLKATDSYEIGLYSEESLPDSEG